MELQYNDFRLVRPPGKRTMRLAPRILVERGFGLGRIQEGTGKDVTTGDTGKQKHTKRESKTNN